MLSIVSRQQTMNSLPLAPFSSSARATPQLLPPSRPPRIDFQRAGVNNGRSFAGNWTIKVFSFVLSIRPQAPAAPELPHP